jgi:site-specific DNA-methyltransferase (adenine-specific)
MTLKIESLPIDKLKFDPTNARKHSNINLSAIAESLKQFGQRKPIVITCENVIVAGNGTVEAARLLGLTDVDVVRVPKDWSADQVKAFALADNRTAELAEWNPEVLSAQLLELDQAGFDIEALGFELQEPEESQLIVEDEVPEVSTARVATGDLWKLGQHLLLCGDSLDRKSYQNLLGGKSAEMLFTDPPYGVDYEGVTNDHLKAEAFRSFLTQALTLCFENLKPGSNAYVWHADVHAYEVIGAFRDAGFHQAKPAIIQWVKDSLVLSQGDYHLRNEPCLFGWKEGSGRVRVQDRTQDTIWEAPKPKRAEGHPTMKPVEICARAIRNSSKPGFVVLDVFGGSGSTLIACEKLNRKARLIEMDETYCDLIIQRWEALTGEKAVLLNASR